MSGVCENAPEREEVKERMRGRMGLGVELYMGRGACICCFDWMPNPMGLSLFLERKGTSTKLAFVKWVRLLLTRTECA